MLNSIFSVFYIREKKKFLFCDKPAEAFIYYKEFRINLLSGEKEPFELKHLLEYLESIDINKSLNQPKVFHLFYELGFLFNKNKQKIPKHEPLAITINYSTSKFIKPGEQPSSISLNLLEYPKVKDYKNKFKKVKRHLIDGNCYQVNLTHPFYLKSSEPLESADYLNLFLSLAQGLGAYAHFTSIGSMDKVFFSNSPECLFKAFNKNKKLYIRSMPIKGTISNSFGDAWQRLVQSKKDQAELFMISDLVRNDLAKIKLTPAKILKKKVPLKVPGLLHQYSIVETQISQRVSLLDIVGALFPGGSITGAPKKKVMEIIDDLEGYSRGFYCGSTILLHKGLKVGSINIRSAEVSLDKNEIKYGAGGGITLLSKADEEFKETYLKMESFLQFLKVDLLNKS